MSEMEDTALNIFTVDELLRREARLRMMIDAVPAMLTYMDTEQRLLFCNKPYLELLRLPERTVVGRTLEQLLGADLYQILRAPIRQVLNGTIAKYDRQHIGPDGAMLDLSVTFVPHIEHDVVVGFFGLTMDVTAVKVMGRKLAHLAGHDNLTGLPNRMLYAEHLAQALERNRRHTHTFALAFVDIDHFKVVNDTQGHGVGDELLRVFSERLRSILRGCDLAARLGGDEFAIIIEGPVSNDQASALGKRLVETMSLPFELGSHALTVTISVGIAIARSGFLTAAVLETSADEALYRSKARGRNTFVLAT